MSTRRKVIVLLFDIEHYSSFNGLAVYSFPHHSPHHDPRLPPSVRGQSRCLRSDLRDASRSRTTSCSSTENFRAAPDHETYLYHLFRIVCESLVKVGEDAALTGERSMRSYTLDGPDGIPLIVVRVQDQEENDAFLLNKAVMYEDSCPACREINAARKAALDVEDGSVDAGSP
ncbi:hypothetical protein PHSY_005711 [Pseudozyma hubeiensis SY62]|uniref:Uncharacterized protein n=1 Tax=Pseudozyma hubeiensis (strain SY62) TaxID=1305764 RepID=R9PA39_PSEHS|nr:hypothetical protein PHSY_005711 [Pseudozyma hubeiensis SY62]GAC98122.1 hypothetical protein PHSY_005711 [Pseudozyma hubeiensis SY62]